MFNRIIVPTDGSDASWRAVVVGGHLAVQCAAELELLQSVDDPAYAREVERLLRRRLSVEDVRPESAFVTSKPCEHTVAKTVASHLESVNGGVVVMSSHGRGRSAGLLGSVATDVLNETFGPVIVVGPDAQIDRPNFRGEIVVAVDGSPRSETALGLAGAWGIGLGARPWVATVIATAASPEGVDTFESAYPARLAHHLESTTKHPVEFEVLHGGDPALAVADFASSIDAGLVVATTHGRTGLARIALGSVAAGFVRHAPCPVVLLRPPTLPRPTQSTVSAHTAGH